MFEAAFLERGVQSGRPSAQQWRTALDDLRKRLRRCAHTRLHVHPDHLLACPWCELERQGVVYFLALDTPPPAVAPSRFDATKTWATIQAITLTSPPLAPKPSQLHATPRPLPPGMPQPARILSSQVVLVALAALFSWAAPKLFLVFAAVAFWACARVQQTLGAARSRERVARNAAVEVARRNFDTLTNRLQHEGASSAFEATKRQLREAHEEWLGLDAKQKAELEGLKTRALQRQRERYLEQFLILAARINGVGPTKRAALRSFGIETAADVTAVRVRAVPGFGDALTKTMVQWRAGLALQFRFDPRLGVAPADEAAVRNRIGARRLVLERQLANGAGELLRLRREAAARAQALLIQINAAAQEVAQTLADLSIV